MMCHVTGSIMIAMAKPMRPFPEHRVPAGSGPVEIPVKRSALAVDYKIIVGRVPLRPTTILAMELIPIATVKSMKIFGQIGLPVALANA